MSCETQLIEALHDWEPRFPVPLHDCEPRFNYSETCSLAANINGR